MSVLYAEDDEVPMHKRSRVGPFRWEENERMTFGDWLRFAIAIALGLGVSYVMLCLVWFGLGGK